MHVNKQGWRCINIHMVLAICAKRGGNWQDIGGRVQGVKQLKGGEACFVKAGLESEQNLFSSSSKS